MSLTVISDKDRQRAELEEQRAALYTSLDEGYDRIEREYRRGDCKVAERDEDMWLADLALYELIVDEMRAL